MSSTPVSPGPMPISGGPAEILGSERASATPVALKAHRRTSKGKARQRARPLFSGVTVPLRQMQISFHGIITHPESVEAGISQQARDGSDPRGLFTGADNLSVAERLGVYHYAYQARLVDCLVDDFPTVKHCLGESAFATLCAAVILERPSTTPNLNFYGRALLEHCRHARMRIRNRAFITQLAELEWAMTEVFHAQAAPTFSVEALQAIPIERWALMTFVPSATARIMRFTYPVNAYLQAFRQDANPPVPRPRASATAVYRMGYRIWRMDLTPAMADLLDALLAGTALEVALSEVSNNYPHEKSLEQSVMRWFSEWVKGGFFGVNAPT